MVLTLMIVARKVMQLEDYTSRVRHIENDVHAHAIDGLHCGTGLRHGVFHRPCIQR